MEAVLLTLTMKYNSCHQWSTTSITHAVLLLSPMKYYSYRACSITPVFPTTFPVFGFARIGKTILAERSEGMRNEVWRFFPLDTSRCIGHRSMLHLTSQHAPMGFSTHSLKTYIMFGKNTRHIQLKLAVHLTQTQNKFSPRASSRFIETRNKFARNPKQASRNLISCCS